MSIENTIKSIGGPAIASELGISLAAVVKMRQRGSFPAKHYFALSRLAASKGFQLDDALFEKRTTVTIAHDSLPKIDSGHYAPPDG
ncbi:MAG: hypothetical protein WCK65_14525 [Rhodospirillaceae bacterium]